MMKKQLFCPQKIGLHNVARVTTMDLERSDGIFIHQGKEWSKDQARRHETFSLVAAESYHLADRIDYTWQEDYVKVSFWLRGRHTTLDGFGQYEHERPEVFITSGAMDMLTVDMMNGESAMAVVALCLLPDFFRVHLRLAPEELPEPLRTIIVPRERPDAFHSYSLTPDLVAATRAVLAAPFAVRRTPVYAQAKAIELMCLLINRLTSGARCTAASELDSRWEAHLYAVRELLTRHWAKRITLGRLCRQFGLNKKALTSGFRALFGLSIDEYLRKERMERAYELLQDSSLKVEQVAQAVGYTHPRSFSTAFRAHFGCAPRQIARAADLNKSR